MYLADSTIRRSLNDGTPGSSVRESGRIEVEMRLVKNVLFLALMVAFCAKAGQAQGKSAVPSDGEINLVVLQADAAMEQFRGMVEREERSTGQAAADAASRDKQLLGSWDYTSKGFKAKPLTFNSELGFEVVLMLDDAARNAALCSGAAEGAAAASEREELTRNCADASTHLHAAAQSVANLYRQYIEAEQQAVEQAAKCAAK